MEKPGGHESTENPTHVPSAARSTPTVTVDGTAPEFAAAMDIDGPSGSQAAEIPSINVVEARVRKGARCSKRVACCFFVTLLPLLALACYGLFVHGLPPAAKLTQQRSRHHSTAPAETAHAFNSSCAEDGITVVVHAEEYADEITWKVDNGATYGAYTYDGDHFEDFCLPAGKHTFSFFDAYGDGWHGGWWEIRGEDQEVIAGGNETGLVGGSGGEITFTLAHGSHHLPSVNAIRVGVSIHVGACPEKVQWSIDGGTMFPARPYQSSQRSNIDQVHLEPGVHTLNAFVPTNSTGARGWCGGYWEILQYDAQGHRVVAGGKKRGAVKHAGGAYNFVVGDRALVAQRKSSIKQQPVTVKIHTEAWANEIFWSIDNGQVFPSKNSSYSNNKDIKYIVSLPEGNHTFNFFDRFGDGWAGGYWAVSPLSSNALVGGGVVNGLVRGLGGDAKFCIGDTCSKYSNSTADLIKVVMHVRTEDWAREISWRVDGGTAFGTDYQNNNDYYETLQLTPGHHTVYYSDSGGDGWSGGYWELTQGCNNEPIAGGVVEGQVLKAGGEAQILVSNVTCKRVTTMKAGGNHAAVMDSCTEIPVVVKIQTRGHAEQISWQFDDSKTIFKHLKNYETHLESLCIPQGEHRVTLFDSGNDGWEGGYWELQDKHHHRIAGGNKDGLVSGSGKEFVFLLTKDYKVHPVKTVSVIVEITTTQHSREVTWNIDGGMEYGNYTDDKITTKQFSLSEGLHVISYYDAFNDGWHGGFWSVRTTDRKLIAGGQINGQVRGAGGETTFCLGSRCVPSQFCKVAQTKSLDVRFLGDAYDSIRTSKPQINVSHATVTKYGVEFDGSHDYVAITNFSSYADDGKFALSFWMTKEECTGGIYEYLYSHAHDPTQRDIFNRANSNVNIYLGCEDKGGGFSSAEGTIIRFNLIDAVGTWASFDYPLHAAGKFDMVTNTWIHVSLSVSDNGVYTYDDGILVPDRLYGFYWTAMNPANRAYPRPGRLAVPFGKFQLRSNIFIGGRADLHSGRHFKGKVAMLNIFDTDLSDADASCLFAHERTLLLPAIKMTNVTVRIKAGRKYSEHIRWSIGDGEVFPPKSNAYEDGNDYNFTMTLSAGEHKFYYFDTKGDGWGSGFWEIFHSGTRVVCLTHLFNSPDGDLFLI